MWRSILILAPAAVIMGAWPAPTSASVLTAGYWRMGEDDPHATPPNPCDPITFDHTGVYDLTLQGSQTTNTATYSADVAPAAALHTGSRVSVLFSNPTIHDTAFFQWAPPNPILPATTTDFGIEAWVKTSTLTPPNPIHVAAMVYNGDPFANNGYGLFQEGGNYVGVINGNQIVGSVAASTGTWLHLALVTQHFPQTDFNGAFDETTFYVDGTAVGSVSAQPNPLSGHFSIGDVAPGDIPFNGNIDEVRLFTFADGQFSPSDLLINQPSPIPEPAGLTLLGIGGAALAGYAWRRRGRAA